MPRNVEIKARVEDLSGTQRQVEAIADEGPTELHQVDTFFRCIDGRLKIREVHDPPGELIYYQRADVAGPRESVFFTTPAPDPGAMKQILAATNGLLGVVKKRRLVYMVGQTRVHLDQVEGLGVFLELEVVLDEDQTADDGIRIARGLMDALNIRESQLTEVAYFDLLQRDTA